MIKSYVTVSALYVNQSPLKELERLHSETQVEYCHYRWTLSCLMHRFPTLQALSAFFANVTRQSTTLAGYHRINSSFQMYEHVCLFRLRYFCTWKYLFFACEESHFPPRRLLFELSDHNAIFRNISAKDIFYTVKWQDDFLKSRPALSRIVR